MKKAFHRIGVAENARTGKRTKNGQHMTMGFRRRGVLKIKGKRREKKRKKKPILAKWAFRARGTEDGRRTKGATKRRPRISYESVDKI